MFAAAVGPASGRVDVVGPCHPVVGRGPAAPARRHGSPPRPVYDADAPDPDIIRVGSTYYVYTTAATGRTHPGAPVDRSPALAVPKVTPFPSSRRGNEGDRPGRRASSSSTTSTSCTTPPPATADGEECISEATSTTPTGPFVEPETGTPRLSGRPRGLARSRSPSSTRTARPISTGSPTAATERCPYPGQIWVAQLSPDGSAVVGDTVHTSSPRPSRGRPPSRTPSWSTKQASTSCSTPAASGTAPATARATPCAPDPLGPCNKPQGSSTSCTPTPTGSDPGASRWSPTPKGNWWMAYAAWDGPSSPTPTPTGSSGVSGSLPSPSTAPPPSSGPGRRPRATT